MISRVLAANVIPEGQRLLMQLLKQEGGLDELAQWMPELAWKFEQMLLEYHDIFSLDKNEIGCTDAAEHIIELLDEEPFKEKFRRIARLSWTRSRNTFRKC